MNSRQLSILKLLESRNDYITSNELSSLFNVTDRTIRSDISAVNNLYPNFIQSDKKFGYIINEKNLDILDELSIPQNNTERKRYILKRLLLLKNNSISLYNLSDELCIGDYQLIKDLNGMKPFLSEYDSLHIVRKEGVVSLKGNLNDKKKIYKYLLEEEVKNNFSNINSIARLFNDFDLVLIEKKLMRILANHKYKIKASYIPMLLLHLGIAMDLALNNHNSSSSREDNMPCLIEYDMAKELFKYIENETHILLSHNEAYNLGILIKSVKQTESNDVNDNNYDLDKLINNILTKIKENYLVDLSTDNVFVNSFKLHISSLIKNNHENLNNKNIYLSDVKDAYPLVFEMAITSKEIIDSYMNLNISEDEVCYLTLHLGAAYSHHMQINKIKTFLIVPYGESVINNLKLKIESKLGLKIEISEVSNYFSENMMQNYKIDLIITTAPLYIAKEFKMYPIIKISPFLSNEDEKKILDFVMEFEEKKNWDTIQKFKNDFVKEDLFFANILCDSRENILQLMTDKLIEKGYAHKNFLEEIMHREKKSSTSFKIGFAMPHTINNTAIKSVISIATLSNPIKWGDNDIKIVILLAINDNDKDKFHFFFEWIGNILTDQTRALKLINSITYHDFISKI